MKKVVTIAGSDSLSGGGLQADIRTFKEYGIKPYNVLTCIVTVEPKTDQVEVHEVHEDMLKKQLETCLVLKNDLSAIKIGMLANLETAKIIKDYLEKNQHIPIVLDPVLALKESGLTSKKMIIDFFVDQLVPLATIVTPNLREAELLSGVSPINNIEKMKLAAERIFQLGAKNVVVKGGQRLLGNMAYDIFYDGTDFIVLEEPKITNGFNNGAGCTFASAIASGLAQEQSVIESVKNGKQFVYQAILNGIPFLEGLGNVYQGNQSNR